MNILLVNTFHYNRGGDSVYTFELANLLKKRRHKVIHFAMNYHLNLRSKYSKYFVPEIDLAGELRKGGFYAGFKVLSRAIYSTQSKKNLYKLIKKYPVDIAHIQNIHGHITPSIFHILKKRNIPIIWTLHDYFLLCPNSTFYSRGKICEACYHNRFYNVVVKRCRKNSFKASVIVMLEEYIHRLMAILRLVDFFITPSSFLRNKLLEYGFHADGIVHIPNFIKIDYETTQTKAGNYVLYGGRLSYEKGLKTLLKAFSLINGASLLIIGDGPLRSEIEKEVKRNRRSQIEILGHQDRDTILRFIQSANFVILPSEWYENFPYSILEAFACGRPVIGSQIGGIPELVKDGETGLLFEPGNAKDLADKIQWLLNHPNECKGMGRKARELVEREYNPELHYRRLIRVYKLALNKHSN